MTGHYDKLHARHAKKQAERATTTETEAPAETQHGESFVSPIPGEIPSDEAVGEVVSAQRWQVSSAPAGNHHDLLAQGWEPFAASEGVVYFRRFGA